MPISTWKFKSQSWLSPPQGENRMQLFSARENAQEKHRTKQIQQRGPTLECRKPWALPCCMWKRGFTGKEANGVLLSESSLSPQCYSSPARGRASSGQKGTSVWPHHSFLSWIGREATEWGWYAIDHVSWQSNEAYNHEQLRWASVLKGGEESRRHSGLHFLYRTARLWWGEMIIVPILGSPGISLVVLQVGQRENKFGDTFILLGNFLYSECFMGFLFCFFT